MGNPYNRVTAGLERLGVTPKSPGRSQGRAPVDFYLSQNAQYSTNIMAMLATMVANTAVEAASEAVRKVITYIDAGIIKDNDVAFGNVMYRAGKVAQDATIAAYKKSLSSRAVEPYQRANRLSGMLGSVLRSEGFFAASATGVSFGNLALLNAEAKHWARLNYGAGAKGGVGASIGEHFGDTYIKPQTEFRDRIYGAGSGELYSSKGVARFQAFANLAVAAAPRPAFTIPRGFWFGASGGKLERPHFTGGPTTAEFYPYNAESKHAALYDLGHNLQNPRSATKEQNRLLTSYIQKKTITAGIAPHRFLDVGVRALYAGVAQGIDAYVTRVETLAETSGIGAEARRIAGGIEVYSKADVKHFSRSGHPSGAHGPAY